MKETIPLAALNLLGMTSIYFLWRWLIKGAPSDKRGRTDWSTGERKPFWWEIVVFLVAFTATATYMLYAFIFAVNLIGIEAKYPTIFDIEDEESKSSAIIYFYIPSFFFWDHVSKAGKKKRKEHQDT